MKSKIWNVGRFRIELLRPLVMGIVNVTPDSFADGGKHDDAVSALRHAEQLLHEQADILDVGGESTRPGAPRVPCEIELERVLPVVRELVRWRVPVSVDTRTPEVMRRALDLGVDIINDIQALRAPGAIQAVADSPAGVCLMHMRGEPANMQDHAAYENVVAEVDAFLIERVRLLQQHGISRDRLCLDPGFGFSKKLTHNLALVASLRRLAVHGLPLLVGVSRKSMVGQLTGRPVGERLASSLAAALACVKRGADIVRVHDVAATVDALKVWWSVESVELEGEPRLQGPGSGEDGFWPDIVEEIPPC